MLLVLSIITDFFFNLNRTNSLTWHNGVIPDNEIWVKFGGDKGGSSFKMAFQIINVVHPNSLKNTVTCACFCGDDSYYNLMKTLPRVIDQISDLANLEWRGHKFRLFSFGDYAFLTKLYGVCSSNARYCCIYCRISKSNMQRPLCERQASFRRSLQSIKEQHQLFVEDGQKRSRAKDVSFSIVSSPMLPVELDYVIVPTLHISLGVFKRLYDLFEQACHELDVAILKERAIARDIDDDFEDDSTTDFDKKVENELCRKRTIKRDLQEKRDQLEDLEEDIPLPLLDNHHGVNVLRADIAEMENNQGTTELEFGTGPIASSLDGVLKKHKVNRQAYHGKSFVGNHVNKCCQIPVIDALTSQPRLMTDQLPLDELTLEASATIRRNSAEIGVKFHEAFSCFADVHKAINHCNPITQSDMERTDVCIKHFLRVYRRCFPDASITPKLHMLEEHTMEQLRRFKVGLGLLNEQGGELLHTEFNRAGRAVHGMKDELQKLMSIMRRHLTTTFPEVHAEMKK
ncbi:uncharacterized protein LOC117305619 [Asterias rubens]|uniref:uncharacterized protein LOC117305619 n=1 Tax=Asterias rubens TaxID=7604 RepID=UPI0014551D74|nr:uncharacterized protein LOC117305619 [Asterias rubens]